MAAWILRGSEAYHWDLYRHLGRPPVLVPPRWALCERIWDATAGDSPRAPGWIDPSAWAETLHDSLRGRSVVLVVPDATRVGAWRRILPDVLAALTPNFQDRTLLIATGTHAPASDEDLARHLRADSGGRELLARWRIVQNSGDGFLGHRSVGLTRSGTEIRIHPDYLDADVRVLLGDVSYHYFAGFGGGPKLVFPGCAEPGAAASNHRRSIRSATSGPGFVWNEDCAPGRTEGNPVLTEIEAAAALVPAQWSIVPVVDPPQGPNELDPSTPIDFPIRVIQGPDLETRAESRLHHDRTHRVEFTQRPDLLVVDAGGRPRDDSFLQAQKSLQHARRFLEPGGRILLVAKCGAGTASAMLDRFIADPAGFVPDKRDLHVQTLSALQSVTQSYDIALWSDLPEDSVRALGLEPIASERAAFDWMDRIPGARWGWLPRVERFLPASGWLGGGAAGDEAVEAEAGEGDSGRPGGGDASGED
ncbi:MAG: lactate racemase domain-containing protein [Candidatus Eisenbacteria bacterium]